MRVYRFLQLYFVLSLNYAGFKTDRTRTDIPEVLRDVLYRSKPIIASGNSQHIKMAAREREKPLDLGIYFIS